MASNAQRVFLGYHLPFKPRQHPVVSRKGGLFWKEKALLKQSDLLYKGDLITCAVQTEYCTAASVSGNEIQRPKLIPQRGLIPAALTLTVLLTGGDLRVQTNLLAVIFA